MVRLEAFAGPIGAGVPLVENLLRLRRFFRRSRGRLRSIYDLFLVAALPCRVTSSTLPHGLLALSAQYFLHFFAEARNAASQVHADFVEKHR